MSYFALGPDDGVCLVDFWLVWCLQAVRERREDDAEKWATYLAKFAHHFYPCTREEGR